MEPVMEDVAFKSSWWAIVGRLDIDESPDIAQHYDVSAIPTYLVFRDGELVDRKLGVTTKEELVDLLNKAARK
jgi:thioredoxin 1